MSASELVFTVIDTLSEPVVVYEKSTEDRWMLSYSNKLMQKLIETNTDIKAKKDTKESDGDVSSDGSSQKDDPLSALLKRYDESSSNCYTLHDIELFDSIYNVHFNKNGNNVLVMFSEIKQDDIFNNITFHDLSGACNAIVVVLDNMGNIIDMNECFLNIAGKHREEVLGKGFFENFIPGNIETLNRYFAEILKEDIYHQQFVTPMKGAREELYRINWQVSKIIRHDKNYIIAVGSDITKFVEENSDLKRQLTSIKVGFDHFPIAVGYMDSKGIFTKMNPRFMKMFRILEENEKIFFDKIALFKKHIGFEKMSKNIGLIKEMSYKIDFSKGDKAVKLKVDIRLISGKKERSKLYIVVVQIVD